MDSFIYDMDKFQYEDWVVYGMNVLSQSMTTCEMRVFHHEVKDTHDLRS